VLLGKCFLFMTSVRSELLLDRSIEFLQLMSISYGTLDDSDFLTFTVMFGCLTRNLSNEVFRGR
jgi:hypothetical protein